jgi:hypothetical protein
MLVGGIRLAFSRYATIPAERITLAYTKIYSNFKALRIYLTYLFLLKADQP